MSRAADVAALAGQALEHLGRLEVQRHPPRAGQPAVDRGAHEAVGELDPHAGGRHLAEQLAAHQGVERRVDRGRRPAQERPHRGGIELAAEHGRRLQQLDLRGRQAVDPAQHQLARPRGLGARPDAEVGVGGLAPRPQQLEQVERVAPAVAVQVAGQRLELGLHPADEGGNVVGGQAGQPHGLDRRGRGPQRGDEGRQLVGGAHRVAVAVGEGEEERAEARLLRQAAQELGRLGVEPLGVVDHEQDRPHPAGGAQPLGHRVEQGGGGGPVVGPGLAGRLHDTAELGRQADQLAAAAPARRAASRTGRR